MAGLEPMVGHFPQDVADKVQSILDQPMDKTGPITKWNAILEVLKDYTTTV